MPVLNDPRFDLVGQSLQEKLNTDKNPDPSNAPYIPPPTVMAILESLQDPDVTSAQKKGYLTMNWPNIFNHTFVFERVQVNGQWQWKYVNTIYVVQT